jgi:hypothetical protein
MQDGFLRIFAVSIAVAYDGAKEKNVRTAFRTLALCVLALSLSLGGLLVPAAGVVSAADELHERCNTGTLLGSSGWGIGGNQAIGQSFTAVSDHSVTRVGLYLQNTTAGTKTFDVSIVECDGSHLPTGTVMTTTPLNLPYTDGSGGWVYVDVYPCDLEDDVEYAVTVYGVGGYSEWWTVDESEFTVGSPGETSTDTGSGWNLWLDNQAFLFELWEMDEPLYEYFAVPGSGHSCIGSGDRLLQTFTAESSHPLTRVDVYADNEYSTQSLTVSVLEVGAGDPDTWTVLTSATVSVAPQGEGWISVDGLHCNLVGGHEYGILAQGPSACLYWNVNDTTGGTWSSPGSPGVTWRWSMGDWYGPTSDRTYLFRVYGEGTGSTLVEGDVNCDGTTNIVDAMYIAQYTVGLRELDADQMICGDTTDDGSVNIVDAMHVAQFTVDPHGTANVLFKPLWESEFDEGITLDPLDI